MIQEIKYDDGVNVHDDCNTSRSVEPLLTYNQLLNTTLTKYKDKIQPYYQKKSFWWDNVKKLSNDYELIYTSFGRHKYVTAVNPPSRSYFKLWEIFGMLRLHVLNAFKEACTWSGSIHTAHLAEGPGGFVECTMDWLIKYLPDTFSKTQLHGMTLRSHDKSVPKWRISRDKLHSRKVFFHYGKDGTGDLYNLENIHDYAFKVGHGSCALVTSDGGFGFHDNFNFQESLMYPLLIAEIYTALLLQQQEGVFVIKVFDLFELETSQLLYILSLFYRHLYITKPVSSRPANAEKYVVGCGFYRSQSPKQQAMLALLRRCIVEESSSPLSDVTVPVEFLQQVVNFNLKYSVRQAYAICKTFTFIEILQKKDVHSTRFIEDVLAYQYVKCKEWCQYHDIETAY
jgi:23S rRNA U2552 (ribose-2'-O)-methylase RlmE/FtsJ